MPKKQHKYKPNSPAERLSTSIEAATKAAREWNERVEVGDVVEYNAPCGAEPAETTSRAWVAPDGRAVCRIGSLDYPVGLEHLRRIPSPEEAEAAEREHAATLREADEASRRAYLRRAKRRLRAWLTTWRPRLPREVEDVLDAFLDEPLDGLSGGSVVAMREVCKHVVADWNRKHGGREAA